MPFSNAYVVDVCEEMGKEIYMCLAVASLLSGSINTLHYIVVVGS